MESDWIYGIIQCVVGSTFTTLGLTIQKLSFSQNDILPIGLQKSFILQPLWVVGFLIFLIGQLFSFLAMAYISQSVIACLSALSLVSNAVFAPCLLQESLTYFHIFSLACIIFGCLAVTLCSDRRSQDFTLMELMDLASSPLFIFYISLIVLVLCFTVVYLWRDYQKWSILQGSPSSQTHLDSTQPIPSPIKPTVTPSNHADTENHGVTLNEQTALLPNNHEYSPYFSYSNMDLYGADEHQLSSYAPLLTAALCSSISVLAGKCVIQVIKYWSRSHASTSTVLKDMNFFFYVTTLLFLTNAVLSIQFLNVALRRGQALTLIPAYYVLSTILAVLGGVAYFREWHQLEHYQVAEVIVGIVVVCIGVAAGAQSTVIEEEETAKRSVAANKEFVEQIGDDITSETQFPALIDSRTRRTFSAPNLPTVTSKTAPASLISSPSNELLVNVDDELEDEELRLTRSLSVSLHDTLSNAGEGPASYLYIHPLAYSKTRRRFSKSSGIPHGV